MAKRRRKRPVSAARLSSENKTLAREANKRLGTKFNTRKKALSQHAVNKINEYKTEGFITGDKSLKPSQITLKAPSKIAKNARASGGKVIRGRIAVANEPGNISRFRRAIKDGKTPYVTRIGSLGFEHIQFPKNVMNFTDVSNYIDTGEIDRLMDRYRANDEDEQVVVSYKMFGNSAPNRTWRSAEGEGRNALKAQMARYQGRMDASQQAGNPSQAEALFQNFELLVMDYRNYKMPIYERPSYVRKRNRAKKIKEQIQAKRQEDRLADDRDRKREARAFETSEQRATRLSKQRMRQQKLRAKGKTSK